MITETYKPDILVKFGDEDIDDIGDFKYCYCWAMRELLDMTNMRGCNWEVLSEHYIKEKK